MSGVSAPRLLRNPGRSSLRPLLLCGAGAMLALASARCAPDPTTDANDQPVQSQDPTLATSSTSSTSVTTTTTTPTGASLIVLPRPPARVSPIFTDSYAAPFVQSGTAVTVTPSTTTKAEGTTSLAVTLQTASSVFAASIDPAQQAYDGVSQTELSFSFDAGGTVNSGLSTLAVAVDDDDPATPITYVTLKPYLTSGSITANTWYAATVPMSALNPTNLPIRRVLLANKSGLSNVPFLIDNIRLSWTDAAPTTTAVYTDSAQNGFAAGGWSSTFATDPFRTTGASAVKASYTGAWGAFTLVYDWNKPELPLGTFTTVQFDISPGPTAVPAAMPSMYIGLDSDPQKALVPYIPGGFKANTWHRVTIRCSDLVSAPYRYVTFKNQSFTTSYSFYVDNVSFQTDHVPPPLRTAPPPPASLTPDTFLAGEVDVETIIKTNDGLAKPISPLIYGLNGVLAQDDFPADVLKAATLIRRGGDRGNSYNWETNVSNGSYNNNFTNDTQLAVQPGPAAPDLDTITKNRAAGRATLVPFVLNDWVSGPVASNIPYLTAGWNKAAYFNRVGLVKPTAFTTTPDLADGMVYTDEHMAFMKGQFASDIYASSAGASRVLVGIDNEPDLYHWNFPMLQEGSGDVITMTASDGSSVPVGKRVTAEELTARTIKFAARAKTISPDAHVIGPSHYGFDGFTTWHQLENAQFQTNGHWFMDDFLASIKAESVRTGVRLLDTWDFHWYPQPVVNGTYVSALDNNQRATGLTAAEIDAIVQGPRSYWDPSYDEGSWITQNLGGPANVLNRTLSRLAADYPGTKIGVTEYYPGGRNHIASGIAVVDSLGVFQRMGVNVAAMWPVGGNAGQQYAFGGLELLRSADGAGLKFADNVVTVQHPEIAPSSVYAGADGSKRMTVLVVNKTSAIRKFGLRAYNDTQLKNVSVYRIDAAHPAPYLVTTEALTKNNAYAYAAPGLSATMLVFTAP